MNESNDIQDDLKNRKAVFHNYYSIVDLISNFILIFFKFFRKCLG